MNLIKSIMLAILISLTSWLGGCDDDDDQSADEPPAAGSVVECDCGVDDMDVVEEEE